MGFFDDLGNALGAVASAAGDFIQQATAVVADTATAVVDAIVDTTQSAVTWVTQTVGNLVGGGVGRAIRRGGEIVNAVLDGIRAVAHAISDGIRLIGRIVGGLLRGEGLDRLLNGIFSFFGHRIDPAIDEKQADSTPNDSADGMTVALVPDAWSFMDSGVRRFFRIVDPGHVEWRTADQSWQPLEAGPGLGQSAVSYHVTRAGQTVDPAPLFDMIAADGGRVFAKEKGYAKFYFTMLEPMFRRNPNINVRSAYFKLDPEQGQADARTDDRLNHLANEDNDHPAVLRFPAFRLLLAIPATDSMAVNVDAHLKIWHLLDARPPQNGTSAPTSAGFPPSETVVRYLPNQSFMGSVIAKQAFRIQCVLALGVGHEHWHEHESTIYGGELDSLDGPGLRFILPGRRVYQFFNGPVSDKGGFIDGTANYYALCQFLPDDQINPVHPPPNAFGILWIDEQTVLSERWRLLHPDDSKFGGLEDIIPSAAVQYLDRDAGFDTLRFDRSKYWCPFRAGHINQSSRMAVSRQVIVVNGFDPSTGRVVLYSINFSFGTCDRTWRWRYPPNLGEPPEPVAPAGFLRALATSTSVGATAPGPVGSGESTEPTAVPTPPAADVAIEQLGLREDMTLYLRQTVGDRRWYWFQHYLPADNTMHPDGENLKLPAWPWYLFSGGGKTDANGPMPTKRYEHPWQFVRADVFEVMHSRFSHFGVYERNVDSRSQYYLVELESESKLTTADIEAALWIDRGRRLFIDRLALDWERVNPFLRDVLDRGIAALDSLPSDLPDDVQSALRALVRLANGRLSRTDVEQLVADWIDGPLTKSRHDHGLFNPFFVFRLRYREPLGWILVHADKRDDDLLPFSNVPSATETPLAGLQLSAIPSFGAWDAPATGSIALRVVRQVAVKSPPMVKKVKIRVMPDAAGKPDSVRIQFERACAESELAANVWRIRIGVLPANAVNGFSQELILFDRLREANFQPVAGADGWYGYEWSLAAEPAATKANVGLYLNEPARIANGTSIWFEDVVGHVAIPDHLVFE